MCLPFNFDDFWKLFVGLTRLVIHYSQAILKSFSKVFLFSRCLEKALIFNAPQSERSKEFKSGELDDRFNKPLKRFPVGVILAL